MRSTKNLWMQKQIIGRSRAERHPGSGKTAERICRFYNDYYEIGFPEGTLLEEFLCYTDKEEHNVLVSRFFSMVKDQRDRLNKLRVLGDDCIWGEEGPDRGMEFCDRMGAGCGEDGRCHDGSDQGYVPAF